jgi:phage terminase large subunit-like protein
MRTEPGMTERAFLQEVEAQFLADEGEVFSAWMFEDRIVEPYQVPNFVRWYRGFDTATGDKSWNDDTATVKVCYDQTGNMWLRGFKTKKLTPAELNNWAKEIILGDGLTTYHVIEAHNTGYGIAGFLQRQPGYEKLINLQKIGRAQGGKRQRAGILAAMAEDKKVYIVKEGEYQKFYDQLLNFTGYVDGEQDDLIDAVSVVTTFIKEQKSAYEQIKVQNPYNPSNSPSARAFARLQAIER